LDYQEFFSADTQRTPDKAIKGRVDVEIKRTNINRWSLTMQARLQEGSGIQIRLPYAQWVYDDELRSVSLTLSQSPDFSSRQILDALIRIFAVIPPLKNKVTMIHQESSTLGQMTVSYRVEESTDTLKINKTRQWSIPEQGVQIEGETEWLYETSSGRLEQVVSQERSATRTDSRTIVLKISPSQESFQNIDRPDTTQSFDGLADPRLQTADRKVAWEQRLQSADIPGTLDRLKQSPIDPALKPEITQILEAWLSLQPQQIPQVTQILLNARPGDDAFHLAAIILAKLRVSEVNPTFVELAQKLKGKPELLEDLALYFNDLAFPDQAVFKVARDLAENLDEKSGVRFALALGSMVGQSENQDLKDSYRLYLENKVEQAPSPREKAIWLSSLGNGGAAESLELIQKYTSDPDPEISAVAINALRKYPWAQIKDPVGRILDKGQESDVIQLIKVLGEVHPPPEEQAPILDALARSPSEAVRKRGLALEQAWK
jgi:hypothetical protein